MGGGVAATQLFHELRGKVSEALQGPSQVLARKSGWVQLPALRVSMSLRSLSLANMRVIACA